ncbi:MAG: GNAT family N-acetyltransferase [Desulfobulbaceae bacterium]|nr:GNAT family N-acetyltransferase [Desulfobulbaceae bacterium]
MHRPELSTRSRRKDAAGVVETSGLLLEWTEAPWDTAIYGYPVLQIIRIEVIGPSAPDDLSSFETARDRLGAGLVSCRLPHERLNESMLLEDRGFRFIEMVYLPELDDLKNRSLREQSGLDIRLAVEGDIPALRDIAGSAFRNERLYMDPRLDAELSDERYRRWVHNSLSHPGQRLYVVTGDGYPVAFFITEMFPDGTCYWHLNAVAPEAQGRGYGRRVWNAMLGQAKSAGAVRVRTCIAARNHRVLNLYARLDFRFPPPLMTFHWVRPAQP